jgi:DNA-binding MarR family transcriptional regulator
MTKTAASPRPRTSRGARRTDAATPPASLSPDVADVLARFRVVFRAVREHNLRIEEVTGIGGPALRALAVVQATPGLRVTELARALMVRQPTASQIVDELEAAGMLRRRRAARDQRAVELHPTAKARRALAAAPGPVIGVLPAALAALPAEDLARLGASLDALIEHLARHDESARFRPIAQL